MAITYQGKKCKLIYSTDNRFNKILKELNSLKFKKRKRIKQKEFNSKS